MNIIEELAKDSIKKFLEDTSKSVDLPMLALSKYEKLLSDFGFDIEFDSEYYDTNGWQVDFWWKFTKDSDEYTLSGSLYDGDWSIRKN